MTGVVCRAFRRCGGIGLSVEILGRGSFPGFFLACFGLSGRRGFVCASGTERRLRNATHPTSMTVKLSTTRPNNHEPVRRIRDPIKSVNANSIRPNVLSSGTAWLAAAEDARQFKANAFRSPALTPEPPVTVKLPLVQL